MSKHTELIFNFSGLQDVTSEVSQTCFQWCQEAVAIHQSNVTINNLGVVALSLIALFAYSIITQWNDEISQKLEINKETLQGYGNILIHFAFMLLAVFLAYYAWFN